MPQSISDLSQADQARVEAQRAWVRGHFTPGSEGLYNQLHQKLRLLDTIIKNRWIDPKETVKLQSLGIAFGDALVEKIGLHWVAVEDEYGRDPALRYKGTSIIAFPLTMISKRIERGEAVDVYKLFDGVCSALEKQIEMEGRGEQ
jgi:hypothetical protein